MALASGGAALASTSAQAAELLDYAALTAASTSNPLEVPTTVLAFEALVNVGPLVDMGVGPLGRRRIVDILGGQFAGPRLRGRVLAGGADRQLLRNDGVRHLHAVYELKTDDGVIISVSNHVIVDDPVGRPRYARSHIELSAPDGPYGWVNNRIFVGTLHPLMPQRPAVLVRVFEVV